MSRKYKFHEKEGAYFVSFATVNWIDVFTRDFYFAQLEQAEISSTASAMPLARAHKVEPQT